MNNMKNEIHAFVERLVTLNSQEDRKNWTKQDCQELVNMLEACISHRLLLRIYLAVLQTTLNGHVRDNGFLTIEQADDLAEVGLSAFAARDLVRLALDPVSMWTLHEAVYENFSERWANRVIDADEKLHRLGPDTDEMPLLHAQEIPWKDLDLVSQPSFLALLKLEDLPSSFSQTNDSFGPNARVAANVKPSAATAGSLPTVALSASQNRLTPDETCSAARDVAEERGVLFTFRWRGAKYTLSADAEAIVYVDAPSTATHLKVGEKNRYLLQSTDTEGLYQVTGVKRAPLRRLIEAEETVTFWSKDMEDE